MKRFFLPHTPKQNIFCLFFASLNVLFGVKREKLHRFNGSAKIWSAPGRYVECCSLSTGIYGGDSIVKSLVRALQACRHKPRENKCSSGKENRFPSSQIRITVTQTLWTTQHHDVQQRKKTDRNTHFTKNNASISHRHGPAFFQHLTRDMAYCGPWKTEPNIFSIIKIDFQTQTNITSIKCPEKDGSNLFRWPLLCK